MYGSVRKCKENVWTCMDMYGNVWQCMEMYKMYRKIYETSIEICENLQKCIEMY